MDLDIILEQVGLTRFHWKLVLITGAAWLILALLITVIGFTFADLALAWGLSGLALGGIGSAAIVGLFGTTFLFLRVANSIGRKPLFQGALLWCLLFVVGTAFAPSPVTLFALRLLTGLGLGGLLVVTPVLLSEWLPPRYRDKILSYFDLFWPAGFLAAVVLSYLSSHMLGWEYRSLFLLCGAFTSLVFLSSLLVPETPYFLAKSGKIDHAKEVLSQIGHMMKVSDVTVTTNEEVRTSRDSGFGGLWQRGSARRTAIVAAIIWAVQNLTYYTFFLWLPMMVYSNKVAPETSYYPLLLSFALGQFPGQIGGTWLAKWLSSRWTLIGCFALNGLAFYILATLESFSGFVIALLAAGVFNLAAWGALYSYTVELLPPMSRTVGTVVAQTVGKIAAVAGPLFFGFIWDNTGNSLAGLSVIAFAAILAALFTTFAGHARDLREGMPVNLR